MTAFIGDIPYKVIEYAPGKWAPVVSKDGEWKFTGGIVFNSAEAAEAGAEGVVEFERKFWSEQLADRERAVVVKGVHYRMGEQTGTAPPGPGRGFGGRTFRLRDLATGEVTACSDLWFQGEVPDFARPHFPDTHEFVGGSA